MGLGSGFWWIFFWQKRKAISQVTLFLPSVLYFRPRAFLFLQRGDWLLYSRVEGFKGHFILRSIKITPAREWRKIQLERMQKLLVLPITFKCFCFCWRRKGKFMRLLSWQMIEGCWLAWLPEPCRNTGIPARCPNCMYSTVPTHNGHSLMVPMLCLIKPKRGRGRGRGGGVKLTTTITQDHLDMFILGFARYKSFWLLRWNIKFTLPTPLLKTLSLLRFLVFVNPHRDFPLISTNQVPSNYSLTLPSAHINIIFSFTYSFTHSSVCLIQQIRTKWHSFAPLNLKTLKMQNIL